MVDVDIAALASAAATLLQFLPSFSSTQYIHEMGTMPAGGKHNDTKKVPPPPKPKLPLPFTLLLYGGGELY